MIWSKLIVDEVLGLPDIPYGMRDNLSMWAGQYSNKFL